MKHLAIRIVNFPPLANGPLVLAAGEKAELEHTDTGILLTIVKPDGARIKYACATQLDIAFREWESGA